jgi:hypothetical protein
MLAYAHVEADAEMCASELTRGADKNVCSMNEATSCAYFTSRPKCDTHRVPLNRDMYVRRLNVCMLYARMSCVRMSTSSLSSVL